MHLLVCKIKKQEKICVYHMITWKSVAYTYKHSDLEWPQSVFSAGIIITFQHYANNYLIWQSNIINILTYYTFHHSFISIGKLLVQKYICSFFVVITNGRLPRNFPWNSSNKLYEVLPLLRMAFSVIMKSSKKSWFIIKKLW